VCTKFDDSSFSRSRDMIAACKTSSGSYDPDSAHFRSVLSYIIIGYDLM